jgi:tetratricopeptide (TPR) repeat protein
MIIMKKFPLIIIVAACFAACSSVPSPPEAPEKENTFLEKLAAQLYRNDIDGALSLFDTLPADEAKIEKNILLKASVLVSAGRIPDARAEIQNILAENSGSLDARFTLSEIEAITGNTKQQRLILEGIVKADPAYIPALDALGYISLNAKNYKNAESYFDKTLKIKPEDMDALLGKAAIYRLRRNPNEAITMLSRAIEHHPGASAPFAERGRIYREAGNLEFAIKDLDQAEQFDKNNYWIAYDKARTLLDMDKKQDALNEFIRAQKINPNNFIAYVYSAGIHDDLHDTQNAIQDYEKLTRLKPDYYFAWEMLGVHFMKEKQYIKARNAFLQAQQLAPDEYNYALLAAINTTYAGGNMAQIKPVLEGVMRKMDRTKLEYYLVRLFYDFSGDGDVARRVSTEKEPRQKALGLFYLAYYFDIRGNHGLAGTFFSEYKAADRKDMIEWRIYDWVVADNSLPENVPATALKK